MGLAGAQRIVTEGGHVAITGLNEERLERARSLLPAASLILKAMLQAKLIYMGLVRLLTTGVHLMDYG